MLRSLVCGAAIAGIGSILALTACSGGARLTPNVAPQGYAPFAFFPHAGATIKSLKWGKLPKADAGKAFKKPEIITLAAIGTNGKPISGPYATPVSLSDSDALKATQLFVNNKPASKTNTVTGSTSVITLEYTGLAIEPATFSADASGVKTAKVKFAPKLSSIDYDGPTVGGKPEIDLYSTTPATQGFSGAFSVTQNGWSGKFKKPFTYAFKGIGGKSNNCPGPSGAYSVSPASKKIATIYTVSATAKAGAGECLMTMSGGGKTVAITLTFTTSGIVINGRQAP
ncbi:MAG: hypothetical protein JO092_00145 [Candidatus Eremiobacteraeota bacterium]|nr:hypothetical protein [Candidatus Eremiobacteraeota bacterium]